MSLPTVTPMLSYEDPGAAADWLCRAFGFAEASRLTEDDGRVSHVELRLGGGAVMLGSPSGYVNPLQLRNRGAPGAWDTPYVIDGVHVLVENVDAHARRAREAGARLLSEPEDTPYGERIYRVEDVEGHRWMFAHVVKDSSSA